MPIKRMTFGEAVEAVRQLKAAVPKDSWGDAHEAQAVRALMDAEDAYYAQAAVQWTIEHPQAGRGLAGLLRGIKETAPKEPWLTSNRLRNRIIEAVPHDFLALSSAPDHETTSRVRSDLWEFLGVPHDDPLWLRFSPAPLSGPTGPGCRWDYLRWKPALRSEAPRPEHCCDCYRCAYRDRLGPPEAWHAAFAWAERHAPDGTPLDPGVRWDPLRNRVPEYDLRLARWRARQGRQEKALASICATV